MKRKHLALRRDAVAFCIALTILLMGSALVAAQGPIEHFVSVGGPDVDDPNFEGSGPGTDKNYSLTAFLYTDGTVRGMLVDRWATPGTVFKADIDCLYVEDNNAWLSGVVTQGETVDENGDPLDVTGWYVRTRVQDNGHNNDPANPDRIGISVLRPDIPWVCSEKRGGLFNMPRGQVIVR